MGNKRVSGLGITRVGRCIGKETLLMGKKRVDGSLIFIVLGKKSMTIILRMEKKMDYFIDEDIYENGECVEMCEGNESNQTSP